MFSRDVKNVRVFDVWWMDTITMTYITNGTRTSKTHNFFGSSDRGPGDGNGWWSDGRKDESLAICRSGRSRRSSSRSWSDEDFLEGSDGLNSTGCSN